MRRKRFTLAAITISLTVLAFSALPFRASALAGKIVLIDAEFVVRPGQYRVTRFHVGSSGGNVVGRFRSDSNIEVYILDDDALENWRNGARVRSFYNSGRLTVANINVRLDEGDYNLVFSNTYSTFSIKQVQAHVELQE